MKKWWVALIGVALAIGLVLSIIYLRPKVDMTGATGATAIFKYGSKDISADISEDDLTAIKRLFDGKKLYSDNPSCGFTEDVGILTNDAQRFCFACDTCPIVYWKNEGKYFNLSESEHAELTQILANYGFTFPCV